MAFGVILTSMWVVGNNGVSLPVLFTAITQGVICAGMAVYGHEVIKRLK
jgi:hypothetical protein